MKVRIGSRGTIVIPKKIRDESGLMKGDILEISLKERAIILVKDAKWEKFHGCAKGLTTVERIESEFDEDEKDWEKRLEQ